MGVNMMQATISNSIITQALHNAAHWEGGGSYGDKYYVQKHGYGTMVNAPQPNSAVAFHHNLYINIAGRSPKLGAGPNLEKESEVPIYWFVNNVVQNGDPKTGSTAGEGVKLNILGSVRQFASTIIENQVSLEVEEEDFRNPRFYRAGNEAGNSWAYTLGNRLRYKGEFKGSDSNQEEIFLKDGAKDLVLQDTMYAGRQYSTGWPIQAQTAEAAWEDIVDHVGVFHERDLVDTEAIEMMKTGTEIKVDAPGGCCVKDDMCRNSLSLDEFDYANDVSKCEPRSCASSKELKNSDRCDDPSLRVDGRTSEAIDDLNKDWGDGTGWDGDAVAEGYDWESFAGDVAELESFLETCLHRKKDGDCSLTAMPTYRDSWLPGLGPDGTQPAPTPVPSPDEQCPETGQTSCSTKGHCEYVAKEKKEDCNAFCDRYGLKCEDEWDDVDGQCKKNTDRNDGCNKVREKHICRCSQKDIPTGWTKGEAGQACDTVCANKGLRCDSEKQSGLDTDEEVKDAFAAAGYSCKGFHGARSYSGAPFSTGRSDDCAPITSGSKSSCSENKYSGHAPLCYCAQSNKATCPTAGSAQCGTDGDACEYLADEKDESCNDFCSRHSMICVNEWDDVDGTCEKGLNQGCSRKRSKHICSCKLEGS